MFNVSEIIAVLSCSKSEVLSNYAAKVILFFVIYMFCSNLAHFICRGTVFQVQGRMRLPVDAGDNSVIGVCVRLFDSFVLFYATPIYIIAMPKAIFCRKKRNATADFSLFVTQIRDFFANLRRIRMR